MINKRKLGIWGYGVFGKSAARFFSKQAYDLTVLDQRPLSNIDQEFLKKNNIASYTQNQLEDFLQTNDEIIASPGVDIQPYIHATKWLQELDVFSAYFHKPIIAITGSIGKTSVTHLLSSVLASSGMKIVTGGNIGTPMFELIDHASTVDAAVLEVSSFQLEHCQHFAPKLAILTNIFPNHLDRHKTMANYCAAKQQIFNHQDPTAQALIPLGLKQEITAPSFVSYFSPIKPAHDELQSLHSVYFIDNDTIYHAQNGSIKALINRDQLPAMSFFENWLIICAALTMLEIPLSSLTKSQSLQVPDHRLQKIATIRHIDFYNDSKSTTTQSTYAAVQALQKKPVVLLLGGLSKGVDRSPLISQLKGSVKKIICFGKEAAQLSAWCTEQAIPTSAHETLSDAFVQSLPLLEPGDQLLLSPAGSSFDLYKDYKERGEHFKQLVLSLQQ